MYLYICVYIYKYIYKYIYPPMSALAHTSGVSTVETRPYLMSWSSDDKESLHPLLVL